ncbi:MAG: type II toxin-antitoxin system VapC family toxin [Gemmatimonadaceae bacterium]
MVIDTSALIAILLGESSSAQLVAALDAAVTRKISAASVVEASLVLLARNGEAGDVQLDRLLQKLGAEIVAVDIEQVAAARDAALRFGRGRHPAALNFGDCFSYALSIALAEPLLFVGDDFSRTDVERVNWENPPQRQ